MAAGDSARAEVRLAVLGDSLTAGYGLAQSDSFPAQLEAKLADAGLAVVVINAGVSGDTTAGGRRRLDWLLDDEPQAVIIELGANDGLRGIDPEQTFSNLDAILTRLAEEGLPVLLTGMWAPPNYGLAYGKAFKAVFPRLAEKHDVELYPFFLDGVAGRAGLNQRDGIHPNAEGVVVIVEGILPQVEDLLESIGQP
ncbi:MAG: arylesterase [Alphaproteobacteria bacterium]